MTQFEDKTLVTLPFDDLMELLEDHHFLHLLYEEGLDCWEGFEDALEKFKSLRITPPDNSVIN